MIQTLTETKFAAITAPLQAPLQALLDAHHAKVAAREQAWPALQYAPMQDQEDKS